ncbi:MAG: hypothetical protein Tsb0016_27440 [Sphingomonadales bacterium]
MARNTGKQGTRLDMLVLRDPVFVHVDHPLSEAIARLKDADVEWLIALDGDEMVGTLSAHDMASETRRKGEAVEALRVQDVMDHRVPVCRLDASVDSAIEYLRKQRARALVVVNGKGQAAGIVTAADLAATPEGQAQADILDWAEIVAQTEEPAKTDAMGGRRRPSPPGQVPSYSVKPHVRKNGNDKSKR